jgi:hypothetical protein
MLICRSSTFRTLLRRKTLIVTIVICIKSDVVWQSFKVFFQVEIIMYMRLQYYSSTMNEWNTITSLFVLETQVKAV